MGFSPVSSFSYLLTTDLGYHLPSNLRSNTVECSKEPEVYPLTKSTFTLLPY